MGAQPRLGRLVGVLQAQPYSVRLGLGAGDVPADALDHAGVGEYGGQLVLAAVRMVCLAVVPWAVMGFFCRGAGASLPSQHGDEYMHC